MGPRCYPETSVINNQYMLRNIPEERNSHLHSGRSLKSRLKILFEHSRAECRNATKLHFVIWYVFAFSKMKVSYQP
jgi:hypothetical protein